MECRYELETLRRSITPGAMALSREEALGLLAELTELQQHRDQLRTGLRQLLDQSEELQALSSPSDPK